MRLYNGYDVIIKIVCFNATDQTEYFFMHSNLYFHSYATDFILAVYYTCTCFAVVMKRTRDLLLTFLMISMKTKDDTIHFPTSHVLENPHVPPLLKGQM